MIVTKSKKDGVIILTLDGKLGITTSSQLQEVIEEALKEDYEVVLDFKRLNCISSAGLWVLFMEDKSARTKGKKLKLKNVSKEIMETFYTTGFQDLLTFV